jgi:hypothetical protein
VERRRAHLQALADRARRVENAASDAMARALRRSIAAHFLQPGLFDRAPTQPAAFECGPPPSGGASPVVATVTTPLLLLPRAWP